MDGAEYCDVFAEMYHHKRIEINDYSASTKRLDGKGLCKKFHRDVQACALGRADHVVPRQSRGAEGKAPRRRITMGLKKYSGAKNVALKEPVVQKISDGEAQGGDALEYYDEEEEEEGEGEDGEQKYGAGGKCSRASPSSNRTESATARTSASASASRRSSGSWCRSSPRSTRRSPRSRPAMCVKL